MSSPPPSDRHDGVAFLLTQLGHHAASLFAEQIAKIELDPPHAGILRAIATGPGRSQQALSAQLGMLPSRVVVYVDELERRIVELREREEIDAIRPEIDGNGVMELLGVPPGPVVGRALEFLLELRIEEGPLGPEEAGRRLDAWWAGRRAGG